MSEFQCGLSVWVNYSLTLDSLNSKYKSILSDHFLGERVYKWLDGFDRFSSRFGQGSIPLVFDQLVRFKCIQFLCDFHAYSALAAALLNMIIICFHFYFSIAFLVRIWSKFLHSAYGKEMPVLLLSSEDNSPCLLPLGRESARKIWVINQHQISGC